MSKHNPDKPKRSRTIVPPHPPKTKSTCGVFYEHAALLETDLKEMGAIPR
jgi:hypothetical protein